MNLFVFNFCITIFCLIPIYCIYNYKPSKIKNYFKQHAIIIIIKLLFISMFIYFIIHNFKGINIQLFIITGYVNFFIFHILEGIVSQKKLLK